MRPTAVARLPRVVLVPASLLVLAVASEPAVDGCAAALPAMPHQPANATCLAYLVSLPPELTNMSGIVASEITDATLPLTPTTAWQLQLQFIDNGERPPVAPPDASPGAGERAPPAPPSAPPPAPAGSRPPQGGGSGPLVTWPGGSYQVATQKSVYLSFWIQLNSAWTNPTSDAGMALEIGRQDPAAPPITVSLLTADASLRPGLRVSGLATQRSGFTLDTLAANLAPAAVFTTGAWHRFEIVLTTDAPSAADGKIEWWVDGTPTGSWTGVDFQPGTQTGFGLIGWHVSIARWIIPLLWHLKVASVYVGGGADADAIVLDHNTVSGAALDPARETAVLLDANALTLAPTDPCVNDFLFWTAKPVVGRLMASAACAPPSGMTGTFADEIAVFSVDDSVVLDQAPWTDADGEVRTINLGGAPFEVPVVVWLTADRDDDGLLSDRAKAEVAEATKLYNLGLAGITFRAVRTVAATSAAAVAAIGQGCGTSVPAGYFVPDTINVYYVALVKDASGGAAKGWTCAGTTAVPQLRNVIFVAIAAADASTLAHEFGHALALVHSGFFYADLTAKADYTGMDPSNVMWEGTNRTTITLGQDFRANFEYRSILNVNHVRGGPTRTCDYGFTDGDADRACPRMGKN